MKDRNWNRVQDISLRALPWLKRLCLFGHSGFIIINNDLESK